MITEKTIKQQYNGHDRGGGDVTNFPFLESLDLLVDTFSVEMKKKLRRKALDEGFYGWDDKAQRNVVEARLEIAIEKKNYINIANLAAMLWNMEH